MVTISFNMMMIIAFIAIQVMAFAMNDPTLIYVSITASATFILYVAMQFMSSSNYSGSRAAAVDRLKATGSSIRDPNSRFNSAMGRTFGGMSRRASDAFGPGSKLDRIARSMGMGRRQVTSANDYDRNDQEAFRESEIETE